MDDLSLWIYIAMFGVAFVAGFVDAIAGGGGLITIPMLMAVGLPPHVALATNKFQALWGTAMASWHFARSGLLDFRRVFISSLWVFVCSGLGSLAVLSISPEYLRAVIPFLLIAIFLYVLFSRGVGQSDRDAKLKPFIFYFIFGAAIGFYDGFLGPGTGSFWTFALVAILGLEMKKAVAQTKVLNLASNVFSFIVFAFSGNILWLLGITMAIAQIIGARLGAAMVVKKEVHFVKKVFLIAVFASICKLIYDLVK